MLKHQLSSSHVKSYITLSNAKPGQMFDRLGIPDVVYGRSNEERHGIKIICLH